MCEGRCGDRQTQSVDSVMIDDDLSRRGGGSTLYDNGSGSGSYAITDTAGDEQRRTQDIKNRGSHLSLRARFSRLSWYYVRTEP